MFWNYLLPRKRAAEAEADSSCPFCKEPIDHLTEWWYWSKEKKIIACKDLNPKGCLYRILVVKYGPENHRPEWGYSPREINELKEVLLAIANAHKMEKRGNLIAINDTHFSIPSHLKLKKFSQILVLLR